MGDEQVTLPALENFIGANRKRLAFPTWLERQYAYDTSRRRCSRLRLYTQWTVLVYNLFLIPDWMLVPDTIGLATILHFAVVTPWMCFVAWLVGRETRTVVRESAAASVPIAIVVQILIIFWLNSSGDVGHYQYFVLLTVLFTNTVQRLPFSYAVAVSIGIAVLHSAVVIASGHLSASVSAVTITTLSAAACLTLISNYYLERDARRAYLQALRDRLRHAVAEVAAKRDALTDLGNRHHLAARIEALWQTQKGAGDGARLRRDAAELVALGPDALLAGVGATTLALQEATRTIPIVFAQGVDPVGAGLVESMARPGGNVTGYIQFEYSTSGKWLELLKEVAPGLKRLAVLREPGAAGIGQWAIIQALAQTIDVELRSIELRDAGYIERGITAFAREPNSGMIVASSAASFVHSKLIISLAAKHRLPTAYAYRAMVTEGGLMSYGADLIGQYRRVAAYVDRILKGEKPADLPVQAPTKFDLTINLKTAKALGLEIPPTLLARADEVIE
jgi:putative tryptophan/tyrosine transport system substrate-binding protein